MIPTSMGANKLEIRKGNRNDVLDFTGILEAGQSIPAGRVCSLNAGGKLRLGADTALIAAGKLPAIFFAWSGTDVNNAPDVTRVGALSGALNAQTRDSVAALGVGGIAMPYAGAARFGTISVHAAVELGTTGVKTDANVVPAQGPYLPNQSTGFSLSGGTALVYLPGTLLTFEAATGLIVPVSAATQLVIGVVAPAGLYTGPDGYATLAFYPHLITQAVPASTTLP